jgi:hypothetical protein
MSMRQKTTAYLRLLQVMATRMMKFKKVFDVVLVKAVGNDSG